MYYEVGTDYDFKKYRKLGLSTFYDHRYSSLKDDRVIVEGKYLILIDDDKRKKKKIEK